MGTGRKFSTIKALRQFDQARKTRNQLGAKSYSEKIEHYIKENLLVQSLCALTYQSNPNFFGMKDKYALPFEPHNEFNKADIIKRQKLYQKICETIWTFDAPVHVIESMTDL